MPNTPLVTHDGPAPTRKVSAYTIGVACAAIGAWLLAEFSGIHMPPGIEAAFALICGFCLSYLVRDRANA